MNLLSDPKEPDHFIIDAKKGGDSFKVFLNKQTLLIDKIDAKTVVELTSGGGYNEYTKTFHKYIQKDGYNVPVQIDYNGQKTELKSVVVKPVSSLFN
jgi:predicted methyltransferase